MAKMHFHKSDADKIKGKVLPKQQPIVEIVGKVAIVDKTTPIIHDAHEKCFNLQQVIYVAVMLSLLSNVVLTYFLLR